MIEINNKKVTPKKMAKDILFSYLSEHEFWETGKYFVEFELMTDKEKQLIDDQIEKISKRLYKILK